MATLSSLRHLAYCWPMIFGRALDLESCLQGVQSKGGRSDFVDSKTQEMRSAIEALSHLQTLHTREPKAALCMAIVHVVWGEETRQRGDHWSELGYHLRDKKPKRLTPEVNQKLKQEALLTYAKAQSLWEGL